MFLLPLALSKDIPNLWGGRREEERKVPLELLDMDGTSTKYEAYLPTTALMLTSSTMPQRSASLNRIFCRDGEQLSQTLCSQDFSLHQSASTTMSYEDVTL